MTAQAPDVDALVERERAAQQAQDAQAAQDWLRRLNARIAQERATRRAREAQEAREAQDWLRRAVARGLYVYDDVVEVHTFGDANATRLEYLGLRPAPPDGERESGP